MPRRGDTYNEKGFSYRSFKYAHIVGCQGSIWLYEFKGMIPLLLSLIVMIPSRNFLWAVFFSLPMIFAASQLMTAEHVALCLAKPPSPVFILSFARSTFPLSISVRVSLTLSMCSFLRVSHFRSVSPVYEYRPHPHGILYTTFLFFSPSAVFAF